jgi:NTP pyrophosphatase (non-canonical NTP hydrolase)
MADHFNELTPGQAERLALLMEEMGEAQQAIGKILRHGYERRSPLFPESPDNREALKKEMGDVLCALKMLEDAGDLDTGTIINRTDQKRRALYLHHQQ